MMKGLLLISLSLVVAAGLSSSKADLLNIDIDKVKSVWQALRNESEKDFPESAIILSDEDGAGTTILPLSDGQEDSFGR
jgi:hypothetical protein